MMVLDTRSNKGAGRPTNQERNAKMLSRRWEELPTLNKSIRIFPSKVKRNENPTIYVGELVADLGNMYLFVSSTPGHYRQCFSKFELSAGILRYQYIAEKAN